MPKYKVSGCWYIESHRNLDTSKGKRAGMCLVLLLLLGPAILTNQLRAERLILAHHSKL